MASVAARAVMGTTRVAPCPADTTASLDSLPKDVPSSEQTSWWPSLLSSPPPADTGDGGPASPPPVDEDSSVVDEDLSLSATADNRDSTTRPDEEVPDATSAPSRAGSSPSPSALSVLPDDNADAAADAARSDTFAADPGASPKHEATTATSPGPSAASVLSAAALADGGMVDMEADACSICLDSFSDADPAVLTQCNHEYHFQCVLEWAQRKEECPMCWQPLLLSDPSSQELLDTCARERKERAAALEAQANLLNSTSHRIVFVRNPHPSVRSRQRPASPWHVHAAAGDLPSNGSATPPRSSFFGLGHRHRGGSHRANASASAGHGGPASADAIPLGTSSGGLSHQHSWFKRHGSNSRTGSRGSATQGSGVSALSSTLSAPATAAGASGSSRVQATMLTSHSSSSGLVSLPGEGGQAQHSGREEQGSTGSISIPHRSASARLMASNGGSSLSSSLGSSPSWRSKLSLRHGRGNEK